MIDHVRGIVTVSEEAIFYNINEADITLQIPTMKMTIGEDLRPENILELPLSYFLFLDKKKKPGNPWENKRKVYYMFLSEEGFTHYNREIERKYREAVQRNGGRYNLEEDESWALFIEYAEYFYQQVERKRNNQTWQGKLDPVEEQIRNG